MHNRLSLWRKGLLKSFIIAFHLLASSWALASVEAEFGMYSNFIWRGTTFTDNKPAVQAEIDAENEDGFYFSGFVSNAEFDDPGQGPDFNVTQELDYTVGKRWSLNDWDFQFYYSIFTFPGAKAYNTDEWNLISKFKNFSLELSLMDDYFGYQSVYRYVRLGYEWEYSKNLEGALFAGFNMFTRSRGQYYLSGSGNDSLNGAGNPDYWDVFFVNRKYVKNNIAVELDFNWTNRKVYSVDGASREITKSDANDFAAVVAVVIPFNLY